MKKKKLKQTPKTLTIPAQKAKPVQQLYYVIQSTTGRRCIFMADNYNWRQLLMDCLDEFLYEPTENLSVYKSFKSLSYTLMDNHDVYVERAKIKPNSMIINAT